MAEIKCKYCKSILPKDTVVCPVCRKKIKTSLASKFLVLVFGFGMISTIVATLSGHSSMPAGTEQSGSLSSFTTPQIGVNMPNFKLVAKSKVLGGYTFSVVVPKNTTNEQLESLIRYFKKARTDKTLQLSKYLPPTTKKGVILSDNGLDGYASLDIYIFNEQEWAKNPKFSKFINASLFSKADMKFTKEYCRHVKAHYLYPLSGVDYEYGTVGYFDHNIGEQCTPFYKKIFSPKKDNVR